MRRKYSVSQLTDRGFAITAALVALLLLPLTAVCGHESDEFAAQKAQLGKLQVLVGGWKGVAQPVRGSSKGSWTEQADWAWRFHEGNAALEVKIEKGKLFQSAMLTAGAAADAYVLLATPAAGGAAVRYVGTLDAENKLTLHLDAEDAQPAPELPARITLRTVASGDRLLVLYEKASGAGDKLTRLAEVGYTRKGSGFGQGATGPECVVTGGYGSIEVMHNGKKYFVCCTGCLEYFKEKPDEALAAYAERKAAEKAARSKSNE